MPFSSSAASSSRPLLRLGAAALAAAGGTTLASSFLFHQTQQEDQGEQQQRYPRHAPPLILPFLPAQCFFFKKEEGEEEGGAVKVEEGEQGEPIVVVNPAPFNTVYKLGTKLGTGAFATVYKCIQRKNKTPAAVKIFDLSKVPSVEQLAKLKRGVHEEVSILQSLRHDRIVQVYDLFEGKEHMHFVMEFCEGGELFDRIVAKSTYNEKEARDVIRTLLTALAFCHEARIVHRDLKPENLLLEEKDCDLKIKLADFGAASRLPSPSSSPNLTHYVGTPGYTAPEILSGRKYGEKVDCWSAGVIAYILLGGYPPFADNEDQIKKRAKFEFHDPEWSEVSEEAKDLISKLLIIDPKKRLSAEKALQHEWFEAEDEVLVGRDLGAAREGIKKFHALRKLRGVVKGVIAINKMKNLAVDTKEEVAEMAARGREW